MTHGDDQGLILPPRLAPYQVVDRADRPRRRRRAGRRGGRRARRRAAARRRAGARRRPRRSSRRASSSTSGSCAACRCASSSVPATSPPARRPLPTGWRPPARRSRCRSPASAASLPERLAAFQDGAARARRCASARSTPILADSFESSSRGSRRGSRSRCTAAAATCEAKLKEATTATPRCMPLDGPPEDGPCAVCGQPSAYGTRVLWAARTDDGPSGGRRRDGGPVLCAVSAAATSPRSSERLGDLHGVERGALAQVVADDEQRQAVLDASVTADAADEGGVPAGGLERGRDVGELDPGCAREELARLVGR